MNNMTDTTDLNGAVTNVLVNDASVTNPDVIKTSAEIFADPVGYLADLGIDALIVTPDYGLPVAA
jgi:hypothetical protein